MEQESQHKDTLQVTEARHYRERGLIHIEDAVYVFFMSLENQRVQLLNDQMLRKEGANMVEEDDRKLTANEELKLKWEECFNNKDREERKVRTRLESFRTNNSLSYHYFRFLLEELIQAIFASVIERYLHMGTAQYLRDFRRSFELTR